MTPPNPNHHLPACNLFHCRRNLAGRTNQPAPSKSERT